MPTSHVDNKQEFLKQLLLANDSIMTVLYHVSSQGLKDWGLCGGAIRNELWNYFHGYSQGTYIKDYDINYMSGNPISGNLSLPLEYKSFEQIKDFNLRSSGVLVDYKTLTDVCKLWPEVCSCVYARFVDNSLEIVAPFGLDDLFSMTYRPNTSHYNTFNRDSDFYIQRTQSLGFSYKYPQVNIIPYMEVVFNDKSKF